MNFNHKRILSRLWNIDYFQHPIINPNFLERFSYRQRFPILNKNSKLIPSKVIQRFIGPCQIINLNILQYPLLRKHATIHLISLVTIGFWHWCFLDAILVKKCLVVAVKRVNILVVVIGHLIVMCHYLIVRIQIVLLNGFWLRRLELYLDGCCWVAYEGMGCGLLY